MRNYSGRIRIVKEDLEKSYKEMFAILQENPEDEWNETYIDNLAEIAIKLKKLTREL